jgi:hypothetical protein
MRFLLIRLMNNYNDTDIGDAVRSLMMNILSRELHTACPGCVTKVYTKGTSRVVDVKPLIKMTQIDGAQAQLDILQGVLLLTLGTTNSSIIMPINEGDLVLLIFSEKALENWGLSTQPANGIYGRQFDMADAFAIPMNFSAMSTVENANNEDMIIKHNGQTITIKENGEIDLGGTSLHTLMTSPAITYLMLLIDAAAANFLSGAYAAVKATNEPLLNASVTQEVKAE